MSSVKYTGKFLIHKPDLNLRMMLEGGQCFRWHPNKANQWIGVVGGALWRLSQEETHVDFDVEFATSSPSGTKKFSSSESCSEYLRQYLRLDEDLDSLYSKWSLSDPVFKKAAVNAPGVRLLCQDPVENLFSFICSSNNNIKRITGMVEKMCQLFGEFILEKDGVHYYSFPSVEVLADGPHVEASLRKANFGYRAKSIYETAKLLVKFNEESKSKDGWLNDLKKLSYSEAKCELLKLTGVGPKVADCVCLMSLDHLEAVPVDTHVYQVASTHYLPELKSAKSLSKRVHEKIGDTFRDMYGPKAGWAQTVLFCLDLKMFKEETSLKKSKKPRLM